MARIKHPLLLDLTVGKNVPIPVRRQRRAQYPWFKMTDANDSFLVPYLDRNPELVRSHVIGSGREHGLRVMTHKEDAGIRVWYLGTQDPVLREKFKPAMATLLPRNYEEVKVEIDFEARAIRCGKTKLPFQPNEWLVFEHLLRRAGKLVSHDNLFHLLWGHDPDGGPIASANVIRVIMSRIRKRIPWKIESRTATGYIMHYDGPPLPPLVNQRRSYWTSLEAAD